MEIIFIILIIISVPLTIIIMRTITKKTLKVENELKNKIIDNKEKNKLLKYIKSLIFFAFIITITIIISLNIAKEKIKKQNILNKYGEREIKIIDEYLNFDITIISLNYATREIYNACIEEKKEKNVNNNITCEYIKEVWENTNKIFNNNYKEILKIRNELEEYIK